MTVMAAPITRLIGVYDADGSIVGELSYFVRARLGRAHCSLCDITHGRVRERADWRATRDRFAVPFVTFHRDDQPAPVRAATGGTTPAVLAQTADGELICVAGPAELSGCAGSPSRLAELIESQLGVHGLGWPTHPA
jgi:hypothetical protein